MGYILPVLNAGWKDELSRVGKTFHYGLAIWLESAGQLSQISYLLGFPISRKIFSSQRPDANNTKQNMDENLQKP